MARRGWAAEKIAIARQLEDLDGKIAQLTRLLTRVEEERSALRAASVRTMEAHEQLLRRVYTEMHTGPIQNLGLALLLFDSTVDSRLADPGALGPNASTALGMIETSLRQAMSEMRAIAAGLRLPDLEHLTLSEALLRVARAHERQTSDTVSVELGDLPDHVPPATGIAICRTVQELLALGSQSAAGVSHHVEARLDRGDVRIEISSQKRSLDPADSAIAMDQSGLEAIGSRIVSIGGTLKPESRPGFGARAVVRLPMR
jgi:signal transduction histidine kinase